MYGTSQVATSVLAFLSLATLCLAKKKEFVVSARSMELKEEGSNGYRLAIVLAGVTKVFHLRRKEEKVSLWMIGEEGNLREPRIAKTVAVYEDPAKGASLLVTRAGNSTWAEVKGMLGPGQIIQPHDGGAPPSRRGVLRTGPHKVSSGEVRGWGATDTFFCSGVELPTSNDYSEVEGGGGRGGGRQGRAAMPATVHPEILVVADTAFYKSMGRSSVAVQQYLTSYFNAVNMRFATVSMGCSVQSQNRIV